jgi:WD40 repeat protein
MVEHVAVVGTEKAAFAEDVIDAHVDDFHVPRSWLLDRVEGALGTEGCRGVLLTAPPGWGKTSFAAWVLRRRPHALRYFVRRDSRRTSSSGGARAFLTAIGHQLAALRPELFRPGGIDLAVDQRAERVTERGEVVGARLGELVVSPFTRQAIRIEQEVGEVSGRVVGLELDRLVAEVGLVPLADLAEMALGAPSGELARLDPQARLLVVVDGVDELRYQYGADTILDWLVAAPPPPANVALLLTSRPDDELLDPLRRKHDHWLREVSLDEIDERMVADLTRYADQVVDQPTVRAAIVGRHEPRRVVRRVVAAARGNFLYLRTLLNAVRDAAGDTDMVDALLSQAELPDELDALYALLLTLLHRSVGTERIAVPGDELGEEFLMPAWDAVYRPLLGTLAVAREPLTLDQAAYLGGIRGAAGAVRAAIPRVRSFLSVRDDRIGLFHATMQTFLTGARAARDYPELAVAGPDWHGRVAGNAVRRHSAGWSRKSDPYALAHAPAHLMNALPDTRAATALAELTTSLDFVVAKLGTLGVDDMLTDLRGTQARLPDEEQVGQLRHVCELEAHHLRFAVLPESGIDPAQQLLLRADQLRVEWLAESAERLLVDSGRPFARRVWRRTRESDGLRGTLTSHREWVTGTAIKADGAQVLTVSNDRTARLWTTDSGATQATVHHPTPNGEFTCITWASDDVGLLGDTAGGLFRWDLDLDELHQLPVTHPDPVVAIVPVLDGVVSASRDGTLRLWRADSGEVQRSADAGGEVHALAAVPASTHVAMVAGDRFAVWEPSSGRIRRAAESAEGITALAATADGQRVVSGSDGGLGAVWTVNPLAQAATFAGPRNTQDVAVTADGRLAVFAAFDGAHVIDVEADQRVQVLFGHAANVFAVDIAGDTVVTCSQDRTAKLWRLRPEPVAPQEPEGHSRQVNAVAMTPDGERVVSVSQDWTMRIWDTRQGNLLHTCDHPGGAQSLALSDDGRFALTGSLYWLRIWEVSAGQEAAEIQVTDVDGIRALIRSPDNRFFMLGSAQGDIYYFFDGQWVQGGPLNGHTDAVNMLAMAPGTDWLASASQDGTVRRWDLRASEHRVLEHGVPVFAVCFSPDGRSLISGADDGVIRIWDAATGEKTGELPGHDGWVLGLATAPDGHTLLSVSEDASLAVWDTRDMRLRARIGLDTVLWCVSELTPDTTVAIGDLAGGVQILALHGLSG